MEYFWIKGVQKITDLGWPLVSRFCMLTVNLFDWKYRNICNNTEEYLNMLVSVFEALHQRSNMLLQNGFRVSKSKFVISVSLQVKFGHWVLGLGFVFTPSKCLPSIGPCHHLNKCTIIKKVFIIISCSQWVILHLVCASVVLR